MLNLVLPNVHDIKATLTYQKVETINGDEVLPVARIVCNVPGLEPDAVRELMHYVLAGHGVEVTLRSPQEALPLEVMPGTDRVSRELEEAGRDSDSTEGSKVRVRTMGRPARFKQEIGPLSADPETGEVTRARVTTERWYPYDMGMGELKPQEEVSHAVP